MTDSCATAMIAQILGAGSRFQIGAQAARRGWI